MARPISTPGALAESGAAPKAPGGPVAVAIVVDQLAAWQADERFALLPADGGFARLRREGTWVSKSMYLHAGTETAPGHASLFTGRIPRETRIVANSVWRTDLKRPGSLLEDTSEHAIGPRGIDTARSGVSLRNLRGNTLADALRERDPQALIVAISLKDRASAFMGGRTPNASLWYDDKTGEWVTSTAFTTTGELPVFTRGYPLALTADSQLQWPLLNQHFAEHAKTGDRQAGESTRFGLEFPHTIAPADVFAAYRVIPAADERLVDFALSAMQLRSPEHPTLLGLSFSTHDYVGHAFGPDSWESWNELYALDQALARLLRGLDQLVGAAGYSVILSADHGIVSMPEVIGQKPPAHCAQSGPDWYERPCTPGSRVSAAELTKRLNDALVHKLGLKAPPVLAIVDSRVVLSDAARQLPTQLRQKLDAELRAQLELQLRVFALDSLAQQCPPPSDQTLPALVCRSNTERSGYHFEIPADYYLVLPPGHYWDGAGPAMHGSPYRYDRAVPLLARYPNGAGGQAQEQVLFGSYYASLWYALAAERLEGEYGSVVGAP